MEDKNKMDQQSGRPNRDQETEKKPTQGSQDINRPGRERPARPTGQRDQQEREKKTCVARTCLAHGDAQGLSITIPTGNGDGDIGPWQRWEIHSKVRICTQRCTRAVRNKNRNLMSTTKRGETAMEMESLKDLLIEELKDLYSAENQILKALPKMIKKATSQGTEERF